jgi:hypothetical protein
MPADESCAPVESQETADLIDAGYRDFADFAPDMLKKKVAAFVFLPWLNQYTQRIRQAARQEERQAILSIPDLPEQAKEIIRGWTER